MWAHIYAHTVHRGAATLALEGFAQPRIEPEIVFGLRGPVPVDGDARAMLEAVEWIAPGFEVLAARGGPCAAILWGSPAQTLKPLLGPVPWVASVHPSPLSARNGFFGSRPFSRVNDLLVQQGGSPVDWTLP